MYNLFNTIFYQPLFNVLILLYILVPGRDFGVAVVLLTLVIRILLFPLDSKTIKSQRALSELEPKLREIRKKFKADKEQIAKETFELYQKERINPFLGSIFILIQLPILFALFKVFSRGIFAEELRYLYSFVPNPGEIKPNFLMFDLSRPDFLLAGLAGILQFFQVSLSSAKKNLGWQAKFLGGKSKLEKKELSGFSQIFQKQMLYFFPTFTFLILLKIPSAIALYLISSTIFSILEMRNTNPYKFSPNYHE